MTTPIPFIVDNLDAVPGPLREYYAEHDGKLRLNVEGFDTLAAQWRARTETLAAERDAALASEKAALLDATLTAALMRAGANRMGHQLMTPILGKRIRLEIENGQRSVRFFQADERTPMAGATWDDLINETRQNFPSMFND